MPNWCNNVVEIGHDDPVKLKEAIAAFNEGKFCNYAIPVPESLHIVAGCVGKDDSPEQIALVEAEKSNIEKHGYANWYDFCVARWGTKWDVGSDDDPVELPEGATEITISFDSAWAPPCGVYEALMEMGFKIKAYYYECGMAFAGIFDEDGDNYYEFGNLTSDQVREELPAELDEVFCISENMAEWEEEEEEENENK